MNTQHTLGPWHAERVENATPYGTIDWLITHTEPRSNQPFQPEPWERIIARLQTDDEMTRANARLIAAAPELLAAVQGILALETAGLSDAQFRSASEHIARNAARAALAKLNPPTP